MHPANSPLIGRVSVPGDKSIAHRALMFAALAGGTSRIQGGAMGADVRATLNALRSLSVNVRVMSARGEERPIESPFQAGDAIEIGGRGLWGLKASQEPIDCGNSGTSMRLLCGVLSAQRFFSKLVGDASLSARPMERVARPLRMRGARIEGKRAAGKIGEITAPLEIGPLPEPYILSGLEYEMPSASAQVKSAILLSGLYADGPTYVSEPMVSRDHTERMLSALGVPVQTVGALVQLDADQWGGKLSAFELELPGDFSSAAFLLAAAMLVPDSRVELRRVGLNPTRTGFLELLRDMGGLCLAEAKGTAMGEPWGECGAAFGTLSARSIGGEILLRAIDEMPVLCALAARAAGTTRFWDAGELRHKESDRIQAMKAVLDAFGVACEEHADGLSVTGKPAPHKLRAADVSSWGDHRVAMSAALLALCADGPCRIRDADCIATSFPRFAGTLRALGAHLSVSQGMGEGTDAPA